MDPETVADLAGRLRAEARRVDERRVLVLAGAPDRTRPAAGRALDAAGIPRAETTVLGPADLDCERHDQKGADRLLGRTRTGVVLDAHDTLRPNALGRAVGAVDGGGLLVVLAPPLSDWPDRRNDFDASLAVPPFDVTEVAGNFRRRLVALLRAHPGIAVVDLDADIVEREGLTDPAPRLDRPAPSPPPAAERAFPAAAYGACLTGDQADALAAFEALREEGQALVVEADRGRGKSSAAGLAAACLARDGRDVAVTAPDYRNATEVFARAAELLERLDALADREEPRRLETDAGRVRFVPPADAVEALDAADRHADGSPGDAKCRGNVPDVLIVDEAAALPVRVLERTLGAPSVAYATTVHGYEGTGRGFSVRFRDRLAESGKAVTEATLSEPIRYAAGDPVEAWAFRALLLDARPAVDPLLADARPGTVAYERPTASDLLGDEHRLREAFGLLVVAHYRTEPDDLARLLDAPNVAVRALTHDGHVASVALLAREGDLPGALRAEMYEGGRVRGNMLPDVLTGQLRDERAGVPVGWRVLRIATHPVARSRGLGSRLLDRVRAEARDRGLDWLGVGYGATPELVRFWRTSGFDTVHLSTTRNERSGERSAIMLAPLSEAGRELRDRHDRWFRARVGSMLSDPLSDLDPDVVRESLRATAGSVAPDLSGTEWRLVAGSTAGAGLFDTAPRPFRQLALAHLTDPPDGEAGGADDEGGPAAPPADGERLLVRKVLQGAPWPEAAADLGYRSPSACMRALGETVRPLVERFGTDAARAELERLK